MNYMLALSINFKFGFLVKRCLAHLAGGMSRKKGGKRGLVNFNSNRLNPRIIDFTLLLSIP